MVEKKVLTKAFLFMFTDSKYTQSIGECEIHLALQRRSQQETNDYDRNMSTPGEGACIWEH